MVTDKNLYVTDEEYKSILFNPSTLPGIRARYPDKLRTIDVSYSIGNTNLPGEHIVNKKNFYSMVLRNGLVVAPERLMIQITHIQ